VREPWSRDPSKPDIAAGGATADPAESGLARAGCDLCEGRCSALEPKPSWQADSGCANRTSNDVSAVADPSTGVAVYDTADQGGWLQVGGTSVSSPIIASTYALVGTPKPGTYPASYLYAQAASGFNDATSGSDGVCSPAYLCTTTNTGELWHLE
jgi:hypothetical protein